MNKSQLRGNVQTVLGLISPAELGITLPHEHLVCDGTTWFVEPNEASERKLARHPVSLEILWWLRYHPFQNWDDLQLPDEHIMVDELAIFKAYGGKTVVELTGRGICPDPMAVARISRATGLNVIMGTGYYVEKSYPVDANIQGKSEKEIAEEFVTDILSSFSNTDIRAGIIGELGCSYPLTDNEKKVLRAGAIAQRATGAAINVHPGQHETSAMECVRVLEKAGADLSRTIMSHTDRAVRNPDNRVALAKTGCCIEYDLFGREGYYPPRFRLLDVPNDAQRINELKELADKGFQSLILISHDNYTKSSLCHYGGWGYAHILRDAVPVMKLKGLTKELINLWLIDNPKRLLTFV